jgi:hypothetical protein
MQTTIKFFVTFLLFLSLPLFSGCGGCSQEKKASGDSSRVDPLFSDRVQTCTTTLQCQTEKGV